MSDFITDYLKSLDNEFAGIAEDGMINDVRGFIDTGSYALNALLSTSIYGGLPEGKVLALAGPTSTGKTFFCLAITKNFLDQDPNARVICFESEGAIRSKMLEERQIDKKRFINIPIETVQQFKNSCLQCINQYLQIPEKERPKLLFILDSLGMLSTTKEMEDSNDGKETKDMTRAQIIKAAFRVLTLKLSLANVPMIITNHTYTEMGLYPKQIMAGGSGTFYAASTIVFLSRRKEKDGTEIVGNVIHATLNKSRLARENMKIDTMLHYTKGLNKYYGLDELALECGIFKKSGTRIELPDGTKLFSKAILSNPTKYFTQDVMDKIDEYCKIKFSYGGEQVEKDV